MRVWELREALRTADDDALVVVKPLDDAEPADTVSEVWYGMLRDSIFEVSYLAFILVRE